MIRRLVILLAVLGSLVGTLSGQIDSRTAYRIRYGAALPAACNPNTGDVFFRTATNIGIHHCTASNTWSFISVVGGVGTFTTINLTAATNQIVLDSDAAVNTGTVTMAALTGARVWTLQDGTGTLYQTGGTDVSLADGGTNASLVASNGGIFYSTASAGAILAGTATANQMLQSGASTTPAWSTATWPATTTINQLLYSSAANAVTGLATANSGLLVTGATGVPSVATDIPTAVTIGTAYVYRVGGTDVSVADGGTGLSTFGGVNTLLYTTAADALSSIATANNGVLITGGTGVPSISSTIPTATQDNITRVGTVVSGTWTATDVALADGGTGASLTASNGGIFYSTASAGAILAGTATAGQILRSGASAAPAWSTATYPATAGAASTILRSDGTNFISTTTTLENTTGNIVTLDGTGTLSGARTVSGLWTFSGNIIMTAGTDIRPSADSTTAINIANAAGTDWVTFDTTNQRVGIGTTGPANPIHLYRNNTAITTPLLIEQAGTGDSLISFLLTGVQGWAVGVHNSDDNKFKISTAENDLGSFTRLTIDTTGRLGINQTTPTGQLEVVSGAAGRQIQILRHAATPTVNAWEIQNNASAVQVAIGSTFGLVMGSPTGGDKGAGTINVATDIFKANTAYTNPDYVLEHWATGKIETFKSNIWASDYQGLLPLGTLERFVKQNYHLPLISRQPSGMFDRGDMLLATVEESYLYLFDHEHQIKALQVKITSLESEVASLKARLP